MGKKFLSLIQTNPYLREPSECDTLLNRSVISSSAIEGVRTAACRALGVQEKVKKARLKHAGKASKSS